MVVHDDSCGHVYQIRERLHMMANYRSDEYRINTVMVGEIIALTIWGRQASDPSKNSHALGLEKL